MAKYDPKLQEEELKLHVAEDWFPAYDCKRKIGKIDFCVDIPADTFDNVKGKFPIAFAIWNNAIHPIAILSESLDTVYGSGGWGGGLLCLAFHERFHRG